MDVNWGRGYYRLGFVHLISAMVDGGVEESNQKRIGFKWTNLRDGTALIRLGIKKHSNLDISAEALVQDVLQL